MKRFLFSLFLFILIPTFAFSADFNKEEYDSFLNSFDLSSFDESLDKTTKNYLDELGLSSFDFESISSLSIGEIFKVITDIIKEKSALPIKGALLILIFIVLSSMLKSVSPESTLGETYSTASSLIIATFLSVKISSAISLSVMSLSLAGNFIYAFIPAFAVIVAAGGGVTTSFSTNTLLMALSQGLSFISSNVFMPVINSFLAVGICSGLNHTLGLDKLISTLKRVITTVISFCAGAFVSILSIKTTVSSRADVLGIRSIRFMINSVVPVVGGSISEGLASIQGYSSLIKSSVGIVGIVSVTLVFLPSVIEITLWRGALSLCSVISNVFGDKSVSLVLNAFLDTLLLIFVVLVLSMVTTIISIGILIAARTA